MQLRVAGALAHHGCLLFSALRLLAAVGRSAAFWCPASLQRGLVSVSQKIVYLAHVGCQLETFLLRKFFNKTNFPEHIKWPSAVGATD